MTALAADREQTGICFSRVRRQRRVAFQAHIR